MDFFLFVFGGAGTKKSSTTTRNTLFWTYFLFFVSTSLVGSTAGLEGIPSWLCLGMKSPFVEFRAEIETLSNITINMNLTMIESMSAESAPPLSMDPAATLKEYNSFYRAGTSNGPGGAAKKNQSTDRYFEMENVYNTQYKTDIKQYSFLSDGRAPIKPFATAPTTTTPKPAIVNIATQPQQANQQQQHRRIVQPEVKIIEVAHDQYIKPLALQNMQPNEPKKSAIFQDSSTNIEDLKRHIVLLHNLTKQDKGFESKFVVFPSLKKEDVTTSTTTKTTTVASTTTEESTTIRTTRKTTTKTPTTTTEIPVTENTSTTELPSTTTTRNDLNLRDGETDDDMDIPPSERSTSLLFFKPTRNLTVDDAFFSRLEQVTSFPQVFLQNDQTPLVPTTEEETTTKRTPLGGKQKNRNRNNNNNNRRQNNKQQQKRRNNNKGGGGGGNGRKKDKNRMCKEVGNKFIGNCTFASNWNEQKAKEEREQEELKNKVATSDQISTTLPVNARRFRRKQLSQPKLKKNNNRDRDDDERLSSAEQLQSRRDRNKSSSSASTFSSLQRSIRSNKGGFGSRHQQQQQLRSGDLSASLSMLSRSMNYPNLMVTNGGQIMDANDTIVEARNQPPMVVDLNPDLCYQVGGFSNGQKKLCVQNTDIMPAISRGARAAIQECKHQFKHRRFDCETVNDDSVFGPITSLGSPEMALIHALAAAGVASFIARACRDGQLASCGCSRSSRPTQLHNDWTWGGCGDDLEFGYKFSQTFIDIREKEKKRGARGLMVSMQRDDNGANSGVATITAALESSSSTTTEAAVVTPSKDLLELQEKITKEILSSKLQEDEMKELQEKINRELMNSKLFNNLDMNQLDSPSQTKQQQQKMLKKDRLNGGGGANRLKSTASMKARTLMNLHNNEVGRRAVIKRSRVTCKCHGVSGSCSLITCWQQLTSIREIGDYLREKYDEATRVKMNKRNRLQVHDSRYKVPTAMDLVYLDDSPDWCRNNKQLKWAGTHGRVCSKTSNGLDSCSILCCGRGYNTKKIVVKERCNCKFHWCCQVKCDVCVKTIEEYTCK